MTKPFPPCSWILSSLLLLLFTSISVDARRASKRDLPPLQTVGIPLTFHTDGSKYSVDVTMSPKSSLPQGFKFALSTSTGFTYVAGQNCTSCAASTNYNAATSNSVKPTQETQNVTVLNQRAQGKLIKEDCTLRTKNGSSWNYPNQTVVVADSSTFTNSSGISGLIGLGMNSGGNFSDTVFGGWLGRNPARSNFSYGMQLNKPSGNESTLDGGLLHWITPDTTAYQGDVAYKKMQPRNTTTTSTNAAATNGSTDVTSGAGDHTLNADWVLDLDSFAFNAGTGTLSQSSSGMKAILDPYYPDIYFPQVFSKLIYAAIPGASIRPPSSTASSPVNIYNVPCDQKMSLSVTFGRFTITLTESNLVKHESDGTCTGTIQEWSDAAVPESLFGSAFIANVYLIFVITESESSIGFAQRSTPAAASASSGLSKGAIAGIAVGSAVFAALIVGGLVYWFIRRRFHTPKKLRRPSTVTSVDDGQEIIIKPRFDTTVSPFPPSPPLPPNSARPLLHGAKTPSPPVTPTSAGVVTPTSPEWRHISYATYQGTASSDTSSSSNRYPNQRPPGNLEMIPDSPHAYPESSRAFSDNPPAYGRHEQPAGWHGLQSPPSSRRGGGRRWRQEWRWTVAED